MYILISGFHTYRRHLVVWVREWRISGCVWGWKGLLGLVGGAGRSGVFAEVGIG